MDSTARAPGHRLSVLCCSEDSSRKVWQTLQKKSCKLENSNPKYWKWLHTLSWSQECVFVIMRRDKGKRPLSRRRWCARLLLVLIQRQPFHLKVKKSPGVSGENQADASNTRRCSQVCLPVASPCSCHWKKDTQPRWKGSGQQKKEKEGWVGLFFLVFKGWALRIGCQFPSLDVGFAGEKGNVPGFDSFQTTSCKIYLTTWRHGLKYKQLCPGQK